MAEASQRDGWSRMASLMALIANTQRDPKKTRVFRPSDFDPFAQPERPVKVDVAILKDAFLHGRVPGKEASL